jgi:hypothetical protein
MEQGRQAVLKMEKTTSELKKAKYAVIEGKTGAIEKLVVVTDDKENQAALEFCKGCALYPVHDVNLLKFMIDEIIARRKAEQETTVEPETENGEASIRETEPETAETKTEPVVETAETKPDLNLTEAIEPMITKKEPVVVEKIIEQAGVKIDLQRVDTTKKEVKGASDSPSSIVDQSIIDGLNAGTISKLRELSENSLYASKKEKNGHYVIAESATRDLKLLVYGEGGRSDLTKRLYIYAKTHDKVGKAHSMSLADIEKGGMGLTNYMYEYGNAFSQADISIAANKLWLLNKLGKLEMKELEPQMDAKEIYNFFMGKIAKGFEGVETLGIYAEKIEQGAEKGRIDIGIWESDFDAYWEEIQDETDIDKRAWLKQAKAMGWLLPDKGRGGGQHTPSARNAQLYGHKPTERIQRFNVPKKQARNWLNRRNIQNMMK